VTPPRKIIDRIAPSDYATSKRQLILKLVSQLRRERQPFESHWQELSDFFKPRRARVQLADFNRTKRSRWIIDSTPALALRTLSSGMHSGMTSPARPWFRLSTSDPELDEFASVKRWLHDTARRMYGVLSKSNFYQSMPTIYGDAGGFGTSALLMDANEQDVIRTYTFPLGSFFFANDDELRTRVFAREWNMTVRQLAKRFGIQNCSEAVRDLYARGDEEVWVPVVQVIAPNEEYDPERMLAKDKPFYSCYFERGGGPGQSGSGNQQPNFGDENIGFLRESGYDEFPVMGFFWERAGEDVYGTDCPGMMALDDSKQLQQGERKSLKAVDKMIDPPMVGPTTLQAQRSSILPGDVTYVDERNGQGFKPAHEVRLSIQELEAKQAQTRQRINAALYADLFLMLYNLDQAPTQGRQPPTATEIAERHEEKLLVLGPVLEQANQDLLGPSIDRLFNEMGRRGLLPPPPPEVQGAELHVEYESVLHQAQKAVALGGLERFAGQMITLSEVDPSSLDKWDRDEFIDAYGDAAGVPPKLIVPDEDVMKIRQARAQAQKAQQAAELASKVAPAAQAMSQTDPTAGLLGAMGGAGGAPEGAGAGGLNG
jgi:hypothetical protein